MNVSSVSASQAPQARSSGTGLHQDALAGLAILVVEDDTFTRQLLVQILQRFGANTSEAASAREGIALLRTKRQDLIISDIAMPEIDGHTFIRIVRQVLECGFARGTPAIAMSAHTDLALMRKSIADGFQVHLSKPFNIIQLVEIAGNLVRNRNEERGD